MLLASSLLPSVSFLVSLSTDDLVGAASRIIIVVVLGIIATVLVRRTVTPVLRVAIREQMAGEPEIEVSKRITTLSDVIYRTVVAAIIVIGLMMILPEFGIAIGPLIAGVGIVGLAVGFGAQNLVKDVINGAEILMENQYSRGDFVRLRTTTGGNISGSIEDINLRRTTLRDTDGAVQFISHGSIEVSSNLTRGYSQASFVISLPSSVDIDKAFAVVNATGAELARDPEFAGKVRQSPEARSIERLGENGVDIRVSGMTEPGEHWAVTAEMMRRLKAAFDSEGIRF